MITRLEVDGFKSLHGFAVELEPFTALIGPNGAGKSNVLDALGLLARVASGDLATALSGGRGRIREQFGSIDEEAVKRGFGALGRIRIAAELLLFGSGEVASPRATRLRYEVELELQWLSQGLLERCMLARESLAALPAEDPWMARHPELAGRASYVGAGTLFSYDGSRISVTDPASAQAKSDAVVQYVPQRAHLAEPGQRASSPHLLAVADELRRIRAVHLEPRLLREPSDRGAPAMTTEGAHLAAEMASLSPEELGRVRARLAALVVGARTLEIVVSDDSLTIEVELTDGRRFSSRVLSDGTLRVLGVLTLLESSRGSGKRKPPGEPARLPCLLAIEEPENGVHASRARLLTSALRDAASVTDDGGGEPAQIVITSHSPAVLAALLDRPEDIVCIDMVRAIDEVRRTAGPRFTRARRVAPRGGADRGERAVSVEELERLLAVAFAQEPELERGRP